MRHTHTSPVRRRSLTVAAAVLVLLGLREASRTREHGAAPTPPSHRPLPSAAPAEPPPASRRRRILRPRRLAAAAGLAALAVAGLFFGVSSGGSTVAWNAGYENSYAPWQGLQADPASDSFHFVTSPVRSGLYAAQFVVKQGYGTNWGGERSELCCGPSSEGVPGTEEWWAWSTLFPTSWVAPANWGLFFQFHAGDDTVPAIVFDAGTDDAHVIVRTGEVDVKAIETAYDKSFQILSTLSKGHWNDFVVHVAWSTTNGTLEVWHRVPDQTTSWTKVLTLSGIPTLQTRGGQPDQIYVKQGIYRNHVSSQPDSMLYDDSLVRGSSFDEVAAAAWGSGPVPPVSSAAPTTTSAPAPAPSQSSSSPPPPPAATTAAAPTTAAATTAAAPATTAAAAPKSSAAGAAGAGKSPAAARRTTHKQARLSAAVRAHRAQAARAKAKRYAARAKAAVARARRYKHAAAAERARARHWYKAAARERTRVLRLTRPDPRLGGDVTAPRPR